MKIRDYHSHFTSFNQLELLLKQNGLTKIETFLFLDDIFANWFERDILDNLHKQ